MFSLLSTLPQVLRPRDSGFRRLLLRHEMSTARLLQMICAQCQGRIQIGRDVVGVTRGVFGQRGLIPLDEEASLLCSDDCARLYFTQDMPGTHPNIP